MAAATPKSPAPRGKTDRPPARTPIATERPGPGEGAAAATWEPLTSLVPWTGNPRKNDAAVPRVLESLIAFGWGRALVARQGDRRLVVGHTALRAARELAPRWDKATPKERAKWHPEAKHTAATGLVPVRLREMTDAEAEALTVADNRLGEFSLWDDAPLLELLRHFQPEQQVLVGYEAHDLAALVASVNYATNPPAPAPPVNVPKRAKLGDLWVLGPHRILCGDNRRPELVARLLDGAKPKLTVTDPPYGVAYDPMWREKLSVAARRGQEIKNDDTVSWLETWQQCPGDVIYVWHADLGSPTTGHDLERAGYELRVMIVWAKQHHPIGRGHYHHRHELCWYAVRKGENGAWIGGRKQNTLWDDIPLDATVEGGPASQKPIELMARSIRNHAGDVYEPFVGAGATLMAAQALERRCFAMDLDPRCVDAVLARWEAATGQKAKRAA